MINSDLSGGEIVVPFPVADVARLAAVDDDLPGANHQATADEFWENLSRLLGDRVHRRDWVFNATSAGWTHATAERTIERGTVKVGFVALTGRWRIKAMLGDERLYFDGDVPSVDLRARYFALAKLLMSRQHPEGY